MRFVLTIDSNNEALLGEPDVWPGAALAELIAQVAGEVRDGWKGPRQIRHHSGVEVGSWTWTQGRTG